MRKLLVPLLVLFRLAAQTPQSVPIAPSSLTFYSFSPVSQPNPPLGSQFLLTFPGQASGSQNTIPSCGDYSTLAYLHYTYSAGNWTGPITGPNIAGSPTMFNESTNPSTGWAGVSGNLSFEGVLGSNSSPSTQNFIQSLYFSTSQCYEYGPEFGFYRLLENPGNSTEQGTVYFYYGLNVNCYNVGLLGSCRDRNSGASLVYNVVTVPLTIPAANSQGGTNFIYSAYVSSPTNWHITVTDPYTNQNVIAEDSAINPSGFFATTASQMYSTGLSGYVTITQQRTSPLGGLTDSMTNPLKMTVLGLAQIVLALSPVQASTGMQPAVVWCMQGGQGLWAASTSGGVPSQRNMQQSYPVCSITVYNYGTTNPATIFSNNGAPPTPLANPFQASSNGFGQFYAPNGRYTVQISGGGLASPITVGDYELFDYQTYSPTNFYVTGSFGAVNAGGYAQGFTSNPAATTGTVWVLPAADSQGCLASNGVADLSFISCGPGGTTASVQYNVGGVFRGDNNLTWNNTGQQLDITGITIALNVLSGYVQSAGGYVSSANSWQGFNTLNDGALIRGLHLAANNNGVGSAGGYVNLAPLPYGNQPAPLNGLSSFGQHSGLLWVSALNTSAPDTTNALNTNLYINAAGGFAVCAYNSGSCTSAAFNSFQSPAGGMQALSFTAADYVQTGHNAYAPGTPQNPLTPYDQLHQGAMYYDDTIGTERFYNGSAWISVGAGGGGSPAGPNGALQFNNASVLGGTGAAIWSTTNQELIVTAQNSGSAGIVNLTGWITSELGFLAENTTTPSTALPYNVIQAPHGGMAALSFTASNYVQVGNSNGVPTPTTSDSFHAGAMYYDTSGSPGLKYYTGSGWVTVSSGSTSPGGTDADVQYNSSGTFAGSNNFQYHYSANPYLSIAASDSSHAGINVANGFIQADAGFLAVTGTAVNYNAVQAAGGGMAAKSFTATNYIQTGNASATPTVTTSDTFHAGAMYYNTVSNCEELYSGSAWACISGGGGGSPGGANTNVQFNNSGAFGGSANFTWNNSTQTLNVVAASSSVAGVIITTGFAQADAGFYSGGAATNTVNIPSGGVASKWDTVSDSVFWISETAPPLSASGQAKIYFDSGSNQLMVSQNGGAFVQLLSGGSAGVSSLNSLTGALSIAGTTNEITVTPSGSTITLATPQPIATSSNVTFGSLTIGSTAAINSSAQFIGDAVNVAHTVQSQNTGSAITFQNSNSNFSVDGNGNVTAAAGFHSNNLYASSGSNIFVDTNLTPLTDNSFYLGQSGAAWKGLYTYNIYPGGGGPLAINGSASISSALGVGTTINGYNGMTTAGQGVAPIVDYYTSGSTNLDVSHNILVNGGTAPAGLYRFSLYLSCQGSGLSSNVSPSIQFNDPLTSNAYGASFWATTQGSATINCTTTNFMVSTITVEVLGTGIQYRTTTTGNASNKLSYLVTERLN